MQDKFLMLPNNLVWNYWDKNDTYLKTYGDKIIHIFSYLECCTNKFDKVVFNIKDLITLSGMTPKSGKGKTNEQFKDILESLRLKGIIESNTNFNKLEISEYINCSFNMPISCDKDGSAYHFFTINVEDYLNIVDRYLGKLNKLILLKVYFYINARISKRNTAGSRQIVITGGKANCFYDSIDNIISDLKIAKETWDKYTKELKKLGLIDFDNIGKVIKDRKITTATNVYVVDSMELQEGLHQSCIYYRDKGYKIESKWSYVRKSKKDHKQIKIKECNPF
ncbi:hypothetical protein G8S55_11590 [Clostridium botulinum C]|uniref:hypothetical protein n=1 Tax=Clostridium botulinum TaxID=1491 RepID=UPI001E373947|nr:hypothetical protein [Clostridium botulinum]MCD3217860.1 hypothetical protein [Clostridium botulinum C]